MKRNRLLLLPTLFLVLLILAACLRANPAYPTPFPSLPFDLTSIAQTLGVTATSTGTALPGTSPTALTGIPAGLNPQVFIAFYFDNINARNYSLTWSLLTGRFQARSGGYTAYLDYWNSVKQVDVQGTIYTCQGDLCAVDTVLRIEYNNGKVTHDTYPYTLIRDTSRSTWMFDFIPSPTSLPSRTRTRTPTATVTRSPTPSRTRTRTPTATPTATGSVTASQTPTASAAPTTTATPTQSPTSTATQIPTGTLAPTPSPTPSWTSGPTSTGTASETPTWTLTESATETPTASPTGP